jgi:PKD repeat protein
MGIVNWTWSFVYRGSPISLFGETVEFTFDNAGSYEVNLAVTDETGNVAMDFVVVRVMDITPPTADAGTGVEAIQGTTVYLDGTGSDDNIRIASYTWTFDYQGVPIELTGSAPSYYFEAAGEYEITLVVTDLEGNSASDTVVVTVLDVMSPEAVPGDDITIDQGDIASFYGMDSTDNVGVVEWVWTFTYQGEPVELTGPTATFVFADAGTYTVDLSVTDAAGNSAEDDMKVTVMDTTDPVAVAGEDRESDQGMAVALDGSESTDNVDIFRYTWTFPYGGGTEELTGRNVQFSFSDPGDYTITLTVTDAAGNSATDSFDLHVRDTVQPTPPPMSDVEAKAGEKVTMDAQSAIDNVGVVKWTWTFKEDGKTRTLDGAKVSHTFDTAGDYKVTLTVEDAEGNVATTSFDVQVEGSSWLWIVLVLVIVVVVVAALMVMRGRGGPPIEEETPEDEEEKTDEIIIEERYAK